MLTELLHPGTLSLASTDLTEDTHIAIAEPQSPFSLGAKLYNSHTPLAKVYCNVLAMKRHNIF
jgi:hypothetical protein